MIIGLHTTRLGEIPWEGFEFLVHSGVALESLSNDVSAGKKGT